MALRLSLALILFLATGCLEADDDPPARDAGGDGAATTAVPALVCPTQSPSLQQDVTVEALAGMGRLGPADRQDVLLNVSGLLPDGTSWDCVRGVEARIAWSNTASSGADLYLALEVPATGLEAIGHDEQQLAGDGAHEESVTAALGWGPHDPAGLADGLVVSIRSDWAALSSDGVDARLTVTLLV